MIAADIGKDFKRYSGKAGKRGVLTVEEAAALFARPWRTGLPWRVIAHGISGQIAEGMAAHNEDEEAHPDLQDDIYAVQRSTGDLSALALDTDGEYLRIADVIGFTPEDIHELVNYQRMPDAEGDGGVREADHLAYQPAGNYQSAGDYAGQAEFDALYGLVLSACGEGLRSLDGAEDTAEVNTSRDQAIADGFTAHNADTAAHDGRLEALEAGLALRACSKSGILALQMPKFYFAGSKRARKSGFLRSIDRKNSQFEQALIPAIPGADGE